MWDLDDTDAAPLLSALLAGDTSGWPLLGRILALAAQGTSMVPLLPFLLSSLAHATPRLAKAAAASPADAPQHMVALAGVVRVLGALVGNPALDLAPWRDLVV